MRSVAKFNGIATRLPSGGMAMRVGTLGDGRLSLSAHVPSVCGRGRVRVHDLLLRSLRHKGIRFGVFIRCVNGSAPARVGLTTMRGCCGRVGSVTSHLGVKLPTS